MTTLRILTYNILCGGEERLKIITGIIERCRAEVVILQEVFDDAPIQKMARALNMQYYAAHATEDSASHLAILTTAHPAQWKVYEHPTVLRHHLTCDIETEELGNIRIHAIHLAARFGERAHGEFRRIAELSCIMDDIASDTSVTHHLLVGDFNSIAPRDVVNATGYFNRLHELRDEQLLVQRHPAHPIHPPRMRRFRGQYALTLDHDRLESVGINAQLAQSIQPLPAIALMATGWMPTNRALDALLSKGVRRQTIQAVLDHGFVDCFRKLHPRARGYTSATWIPAVRVDYFFATSELSRYIRTCEVIGSRTHPDLDTYKASDHFPLLGTFNLSTTDK